MGAARRLRYLQTLVVLTIGSLLIAHVPQEMRYFHCPVPITGPDRCHGWQVLPRPMIGGVSEAIIAASPDFGEAWERFKASDMFGPDEPYNHLGELAHHLVDAMKARSVDGFAPVFAEVENQLARASPEARDLIIVGFLEDLQNISLNRDVTTTAWTPWLGKKTAEAWKVLEDMWSGRLSPEEFNRYVRGQDT